MTHLLYLSIRECHLPEYYTIWRATVLQCRRNFDDMIKSDAIVMHRECCKKAKLLFANLLANGVMILLLICLDSHCLKF